MFIKNSVMSQKPSCFLDSTDRRKSIAHGHEIFPDVSAIAEQFIFLMRTIGTSSACFLLLTRSYRQENRIKRMVQLAINPRPRDPRHCHRGGFISWQFTWFPCVRPRRPGYRREIRTSPVSLDYDAVFPSPPHPLDTIACAPPGKNNAV